MSIVCEEPVAVPDKAPAVGTDGEAEPEPIGPVRKNVVYIKVPKEEEPLEEEGSRVFVGNLPESAKREELIDFVGKDRMKGVSMVKLARDKKDRKSHRGYGFVTFRKKEKAEEAVQALNNTYWRRGEEKNDRSRRVNVQISPFFTGKGKCFWCGSTEHTKENCTRDVTGFAGSSCYRCGLPGHIVKDCPKVAEIKKKKLEREAQQAAHKKEWEEMKKQPGFVYPPSREEKATMAAQGKEWNGKAWQDMENPPQTEEKKTAESSNKRPRWENNNWENWEKPKAKKPLTLGEQSRLRRGVGGTNTVWINKDNKDKKNWW